VLSSKIFCKKSSLEKFWTKSLSPYLNLPRSDVIKKIFVEFFVSVLSELNFFFVKNHLLKNFEAKVGFPIRTSQGPM